MNLIGILAGNQLQVKITVLGQINKSITAINATNFAYNNVDYFKFDRLGLWLRTVLYVRDCRIYSADHSLQYGLLGELLSRSTESVGEILSIACTANLPTY